jgi:hypothetical protein
MPPNRSATNALCTRKQTKWSTNHKQFRHLQALRQTEDTQRKFFGNDKKLYQIKLRRMKDTAIMCVYWSTHLGLQKLLLSGLLSGWVWQGEHRSEVTDTVALLVHEMVLFMHNLPREHKAQQSAQSTVPFCLYQWPNKKGPRAHLSLLAFGVMDFLLWQFWFCIFIIFFYTIPRKAGQCASVFISAFSMKSNVMSILLSCF